MALAAALVAAAALLPAQQPATADYSQQPLVTERLYQHVRFEPDGTGRRDLHVRVRVQTEAGVQALGETPRKRRWTSIRSSFTRPAAAR